jgi:hypothetical protein
MGFEQQKTWIPAYTGTAEEKTPVYKGAKVV